ncbi:MAG: ATP-binding cassette domain-containing protein [Myxococcota bacterium]
MTLLSAHGLERRIGERAVLDGVDITIEDRDRIGLIGRNGAGKSTLIRCLLGLETPDRGEIIRKRNLTVSLVEQVPPQDPRHTVGEAVLEGLSRQRALASQLEAVEASMAAVSGAELDALVLQQAELGEQLERLGGRAFEHRSHAMLDALRAPPVDRVLGTLSLGERRRVGLAVGLLRQAELLVLDEPTNHLDVETIEWLEGYLGSYSGAVLLVTHDRHFLDRVTTRMAEIDRGQLTLYEGSYTTYLLEKAEREAIAARAEANRQRAIRSELDWVRRSPAARTTKSKSRLQRFDEMVADAPVRAMGEARFQLPHPARIGKTILELHGVTKGYGDKRLVEDLDLLLTKGARIGIVGPNGAGKTTLLRMILGEVEPDAGAVEVGQNTKIVYADQGRTDLHDERTVLEEVAEGNDKIFVGERAVGVHGFLEGLLFDGSQQRAKVGTLSGGERTRVALAKRLRQTGNLLILDEPTNDLDLATLRVLEDALIEYPGCVLVVSHDRWFLDRVTTAILAFEGQGRVTLFEGGHADWRLARRDAPRAPLHGEPERPAGSTSAGVPERKGSGPAPSTPAAAKKKRRSFPEQKEFEAMEDRIMEAEQAIEDEEAELARPEVIRELGAEVSKRLEALEGRRAEVEALYARWEALSELDPYGG